MVSGSESAGFELLLRLTAQRVDGTSLRNVASELGMSPTGLSKLLGGSRSQTATRRRLERWVVWQRARDEVSSPSEPAARVLVHGLPAALHPDALSRVAAVLATSYERAGVDAPEWMDRLRAPADAPPSD